MNQSKAGQATAELIKQWESKLNEQGLESIETNSVIIPQVFTQPKEYKRMKSKNKLFAESLKENLEKHGHQLNDLDRHLLGLYAEGKSMREISRLMQTQSTFQKLKFNSVRERIHRSLAQLTSIAAQVLGGN